MQRTFDAAAGQQGRTQNEKDGLCSHDAPEAKACMLSDGRRARSGQSARGQSLAEHGTVSLPICYGKESEKMATKMTIEQPLEESVFNALAEAELARIETALEECGLELDVIRQPGAVLEVECENGSRMVVNVHQVAREIWLATRGGGFHFRPTAAGWMDSRGGGELWAMLEQQLVAQAGAAVKLLRPT